MAFSIRSTRRRRPGPLLAPTPTPKPTPSRPSGMLGQESRAHHRTLLPLQDFYLGATLLNNTITTLTGCCQLCGNNTLCIWTWCPSSTVGGCARPGSACSPPQYSRTGVARAALLQLAACKCKQGSPDQPWH